MIITNNCHINIISVHNKGDSTLCYSSLATVYKQWDKEVKQNRRKTNSFLKRSLRRSHPVSGISGLPMLRCMVLTEEKGVAAGLVEEEEEDTGGVGDICGAATSAAQTLGSREQKRRGLAFRIRQRSRPVCWVPWGDESAWHFCGARPVLGRSGCIMLQLAGGYCREAETHGCELGCCSNCHWLQFTSSKQTALRLLEFWQEYSVNSAAVKWCWPIKNTLNPLAAFLEECLFS